MAPRMTVRALLRDPGRELYGLELAGETGLLPGTAYPILLRLANEGWVTSRWEDIDPHAGKRPARRYWRLTASGAAEASAAVTAARRPSRAALRGLAGEDGKASRARRTARYRNSRDLRAGTQGKAYPGPELFPPCGSPA